MSKRKGNDAPRVIKRADREARTENNRPTMHGSKSEWKLMTGTGAAIWMDSPFGAIRTVLSQVYKFEPGEKEQARAVCAHIAGRDLASTKDMTRNEARAVLDTLSHWREQAGGNGEHPRDYLVAMMAAQDAAQDAARDA